MEKREVGHKICYLILHYKVMDETIHCVASIQRLAEGSDYEIVIVDNGSGNHSDEELKEKYKAEQRITVLLSEENLGFARGNNIGFRYAKQKLGCDFICMMNNDTELLQADFFDLIQKEYEVSKCAVMGPEIHLNDNKLQPIYKKPVTVERVEQDIRFMKRQLLYNRLRIRGLIQRFFILLNRRKKQAPDSNKQKSEKAGRLEDVVLHGCCLIFTPVYIRQFDGLNDATFMFREEEFLYLRLKEHHMLSVYNPALKIRHYEDAATNNVYTKKADKLKFQFENDIISSELLIKEINRVNNMQN